MLFVTEKLCEYVIWTTNGPIRVHVILKESVQAMTSVPK